MRYGYNYFFQKSFIATMQKGIDSALYKYLKVGDKLQLTHKSARLAIFQKKRLETIE